ncbi:P-loop containing nucleoside triphosphate hydrolase protein [Syncephalis pseudoplumigaleata]|uniref:P-loop containing nucleoside triphosphate hydrolase protein n=1 Tax=Syncephalis pseudoplumigaleata TaxID=1712513 RepID=A0A4P9Z7B0_9FUNG|nr:P-loop containing nucleoside triphosphate hydrolase protein [Syncephalis pseudoplumigaleata]|eukprot:RKP27781.1 P-loop containing nucleoside triphosphate hydrolase protein [Syncephalis pseudoplumigaleata]
MTAMDVDLPSQTGKSHAMNVDTAAENGDHLPWVEKYRPLTLDDLVSQQEIISTPVQNFMNQGRLPHLLFYGPPGTGKTSTILACSRQLYGSEYSSMVLELNASDERGIDVIRNQIISFASTRRTSTIGFKLIVLDEADAMTQAAQSALRRVIEKYTTNVRFCIICNYVSKIIPALQSRCTRFRFAPLQTEQITSRLDMITHKEGIKLTDSGKQALLRVSHGDMRRVLNILQACYAAYDTIDDAAVYHSTGQPFPADIEYILHALLNDEFSTAYSKINHMRIDKGLALADIITEVHEHLGNTELPTETRIYLLDHLAEVEHRLSGGANESIQLSTMLGHFKIAMEIAASGVASKS